MKHRLGSFFSKRLGRKSAALPRLSLVRPPAVTYAIGDIHGCLNELVALERKIIVDGGSIQGEKLIVMLGDYVDRGPSSSSVIEHLLQPLPSGFSRICLMGNHDQMFVDFCRSPSASSPWLGLGGDETLASYGVYLEDLSRHPLPSQLRALVPQDHLDFLTSLPVMLSFDQYCFVHAGIDPGLRLDMQADDVLLKSRPHQFNWANFGESFTVVHGHTPVDEVDLRGRRINLDLKVYETGRLAALRIAEENCQLIHTS